MQRYLLLMILIKSRIQTGLATRRLLFTILYPRFPSRSGGEMADTYV